MSFSLKPGAPRNNSIHYSCPNNLANNFLGNNIGWIATVTEAKVSRGNHKTFWLKFPNNQSIVE